MHVLYTFVKFLMQKNDIYIRMPNLSVNLGTTRKQILASILHLELAEFQATLNVRSRFIVSGCSKIDFRQNFKLYHSLENDSHLT